MKEHNWVQNFIGTTPKNGAEGLEKDPASSAAHIADRHDDD
jgi:hypothetical protein